MPLNDWIPFVMAAIAIASLAATVYLGYRQTQHSRAVLSVQLAQEFRRDFDAPEMLRSRSELAVALSKGAEPDDDHVANFFETMGYYVRQGALDKEAVYNDFSDYAMHYWPALKDHIYKERSGPHGAPDYYDNFEWLNEAMLREYARRRRQTVAQVTPSPDGVREYLSDEATLVNDWEPAKRTRHRAK